MFVGCACGMASGVLLVTLKFVFKIGQLAVDTTSLIVTAAHQAFNLRLCLLELFSSLLEFSL